MKIYTKTGDDGTTALFGGRRVKKNDLRIESYGSVDELNSLIGVVRSLHPNDVLGKILHQIQNDLFILGADLASPRDTKNANVPRIRPSHYRFIESSIDRLSENLEPLHYFVLPGGTSIAAYLHFARTVCRRAERCVVQVSETENIGRSVIIYLNRLSDLLFVMARYANMLDRKLEVPWTRGMKQRRKK